MVFGFFFFFRNVVYDVSTAASVEKSELHVRESEWTILSLGVLDSVALKYDWKLNIQLYIVFQVYRKRMENISSRVLDFQFIFVFPFGFRVICGVCCFRGAQVPLYIQTTEKRWEKCYNYFKHFIDFFFRMKWTLFQNTWIYMCVALEDP